MGNFIGAHADRDTNCHTDTNTDFYSDANSKLNPYTKASPYAKASSDPTASPHAAAIRTSRVDRIQMNNLRSVKGPVLRRFISLAPSSVVTTILLIRPAAIPVYRSWESGL